MKIAGLLRGQIELCRTIIYRALSSQYTSVCSHIHIQQWCNRHIHTLRGYGGLICKAVYDAATFMLICIVRYTFGRSVEI